ncbi:type II secretion system inner membrane protein GspF [Pseudomonas luteola]|uniref:type II secretion system inner membrane protein GspF n=1 Tax=Pseudomonas luteola TaxID=47886 RepID=UPI003890A630
MAAFEYVALDTKGQQKRGVIEADSARQARQLLRENQLAPLEVKQTNLKKEHIRSGWKIQKTISAAELALLTRQMATLVQAALPVEEMLLAVAAQTQRAKIKAMLLAIRSKVLEGYSLANSLKEYPAAFPELYRSTVAAGEHAGHLSLVLEQLADYTEQRQQSRQRIQLALLYPIILFVASISIVGFLLGYVVPDVVKVFINTGQQLPLLTQGLIATSNWVKAWGGVAVILAALIFISLKFLLKGEAICLRWHRILLRIPLAGRFARAADTARFASTLSILVRSSVPLVEALLIASQVMANRFLRVKVEIATQKVREGCSLTRALEQTDEFPPMMQHMIASGERSGELEQMLARTARNQENDLAARIAVLVGLFEPFMLVFMGGVVLIIVLAILLPILSLNQLVR